MKFNGRKELFSLVQGLVQVQLGEALGPVGLVLSAEAGAPLGWNRVTKRYPLIGLGSRILGMEYSG